jgi:hypothetical protein
MRTEMNKENVDIPPNHDLSDIDKAYTAINYPRDLPSILKALETIDLDSNTTLAIIEAYKAHDILGMRRLLAEPSSPRIITFLMSPTATRLTGGMLRMLTKRPGKFKTCCF